MHSLKALPFGSPLVAHYFPHNNGNVYGDGGSLALDRGGGDAGWSKRARNILIRLLSFLLG